MMKKRILYVCYGGGHANMIVPIYQNMQKKYTNVEQTVLALTSAGAQFAKFGIPFLSFKDFIGENEEARGYGKKLLAEMSTPQIILEEESIAYLGLSFWELVLHHGHETAFRLYQEKGRSAFLPLKTLTKIIQNVGADLVIATTSPRAEMAALLVASQLGIKSICLFDVYDKSAIVNYLAASRYGTIICAPDEYSRKELIAHGRPESEIIVTGNPAFDYLLDPKYEDLKKNYATKHHLENKKVILWARSAFPVDAGVADQVENALISFVEKNEDYVLIVRTHPNESLRSLSQNSRVIHSLGSEEPLGPVLYASDIIVNLYSTVGIEANLIGKKVIQYTSISSPDNVSYVERDIAVAAQNIDELYERLSEPLLQKSKSNLSRKEAATQIIEVIENL